MKIALVGPGLLPIPPQGWGAVEMLIWKYSEGLKAAGHDVTIFNSRNLHEVTTAINASDFDFVHVHYDEFAYHFNHYCKKQFCITSHYGYILKPSRWSRGYLSIFTDFLDAPGIIALSPQIKQCYLDAGYDGNAYVLRNGIDVASFTFNEKGNGRVLCLGKIEPRKQQATLARVLEGKVDVDFVGPIVDQDFISGKTCQYKGIWTKKEVEQNLTNYSTLLLLSDGEAAPLVVIEALAAGLSVVISKAAAANLEQKEFITVLPDNEFDEIAITSALKNALEKNDQQRTIIRAYALATFDFSLCMQEYLTIIKDCIDKRIVVKSYTNIYKQEHWAAYYFSRCWLRLSAIPFLRKLKQLV